MLSRRFLFIAMLLMPLISKVSLRWLGAPEHISIFWLQGGLHPVLNLVLSGILIAMAFRFTMASSLPRARGEKAYLTWLVVFVSLLWAQAALQAALLDLKFSLMFQIAGILLTTLLVVGYGWIAPGLATIEELFELLTIATRTLMILSFIALVVRFGVTFKGGRFIGIFKHIPYMVTCCQVALLVESSNLVTRSKKSAPWFFLALALVGIVLTGTRSAFLCSLFFLAMAYWKAPASNEQATWLKRAAIYMSLVFAITVGPFAAIGLVGYLTGEVSFGTRAAQDGVASRLEEIERGWSAFREEPWLGHGLLNRFSSSSLESAGSYNSFQDPHNIFVSAGVIGGWPLAIFVSLALVPIVWGLLRRIWKPASGPGEIQRAFLAAFLLSHVPIWLIYHMHLSLGGLADRYYWLILGFVFRDSGVNSRPKSGEKP